MKTEHLGQNEGWRDNEREHTQTLNTGGEQGREETTGKHVRTMTCIKKMEAEMKHNTFHHKLKEHKRTPYSGAHNAVGFFLFVFCKSRNQLKH